MAEVADLQIERAKRLHEARTGGVPGGEAVVNMPDLRVKFDNFKEPSKTKYRLLLFLAIVLDVVDLAELTGIGWFLSLILKLFGIILFYAGWGAGARVKAMQKIQSNMRDAVQYMERNMYRLTALARIGRGKGIAGKFLRAPARKLFLKLRVAKARRYIKRNPFLKNTVGIVVDIIPIIDLLPWRTLGIYLTYRDERRTYIETLAGVTEYKEVKNIERETMRDYLDSVEEKVDEGEPLDEKLAA